MSRILGKAVKERLRLGLSSGELGQAELPVDRAEGQPWRRVPRPCQVLLNAAHLPTFPAAGEVIQRGLVLQWERGVPRSAERQRGGNRELDWLMEPGLARRRVESHGREREQLRTSGLEVR